MYVYFGSTGIAIWFIILVILILIAFLVFAINKGIKAHRFKIAAGKEDLIGKTARVKKELSPRGMVFVEGEQWTAIVDEGKVKAGEEVTITGVDGLKLHVTRKQ